MWKLTIERKYTLDYDGNKFESKDTMHCESSMLDKLARIIEDFKRIATDGEYHYKIESVEEKEGEKNA